MSASDINLLKSTDANRAISILDGKLRQVAFWSIGIMFGVGVLLGSAYFFVSYRTQVLNSAKVQVVSQIQAQSVKEGILLSLKQRISIVNKALKVAVPWGNLFPLLSSIAPLSTFNGVTIGENGKVVTSLVLPNVDSAVLVVQNVIAAHDAGSLRNAQMDSFSIGEDSTVQMALSFTPKL